MKIIISKMISIQEHITAIVELDDTVYEKSVLGNKK